MSVAAEFKGLQDFARRFPRMAAEHVRKYGSHTVQILASLGTARLRQTTPVGGVLSRDRHPGQMLRSWRATAAGGPKSTSVAVNQAPHGQIIDMGRRRAQSWVSIKASGKRTWGHRRRDAALRKSKAKRAGKMLGSKLAPRGVTRPMWKWLKSQRDRITRYALRAMGESGSGS